MRCPASHAHRGHHREDDDGAEDAEQQRADDEPDEDAGRGPADHRPAEAAEHSAQDAARDRHDKEEDEQNLFEIEAAADPLLEPPGYIQHLTAVWEVTQRTIKGQMNE